MDIKIISVHVPKSGGTSTLEMFRRVFGDAGVMTDYEDVPGNPVSACNLDPQGWLSRRPLAIPDMVSVVHGHFKPIKYDLVSDAFRITMLRRPVDNLISIYFYWKKIPPQPNPLHQYFLKNELDILSFAKLPIMRYLYSKTYFGGWDMRKLNFIGKHETRMEDFSRLAKIIGVAFDDRLHLNKTDPEGDDHDRLELLNDKKVCNKLTELLIEDVRFYERHTIHE